MTQCCNNGLFNVLFIVVIVLVFFIIIYYFFSFFFFLFFFFDLSLLSFLLSFLSTHYKNPLASTLTYESWCVSAWFNLAIIHFHSGSVFNYFLVCTNICWNRFFTFGLTWFLPPRLQTFSLSLLQGTFVFLLFSVCFPSCSVVSSFLFFTCFFFWNFFQYVFFILNVIYHYEIIRKQFHVRSAVFLQAHIMLLQSYAKLYKFAIWFFIQLVMFFKGFILKYCWFVKTFETIIY